MRVCAYEGCGRPESAYGGGLCGGHRSQRSRGVPLRPIDRDLHAPMAAVFWRLVQKLDGCWRWLGARERHGLTYGYRGRPRVWAHRYSWELHNGPIPSGLFVLHRCDNPPCVNPEHLFLGTLADNNRDRDQKGRQARGERGGRAKLTVEAVRAVRAQRAAGVACLDVAAEHGISEQQVSAIATGRSWRHVQ